MLAQSAGNEPQVLRRECIFVQPFSNKTRNFKKKNFSLAREVQREKKKKVGGYLAARLRGC